VDESLDEAYERLQRTGPEFDGWLSNHGPMAADALLRMAQGDRVAGWLNGYITRLESPPAPRWQIDPVEWQEPLGDPSRVADWCALFSLEVAEAPWQSVLARWWPRLLPGGVAAATHGVIRTGHVVRALQERVTEPRLLEFAQALGYWAARWQELPGRRLPRGTLSVVAAFDQLPQREFSGGIRTRLAALGPDPAWPDAQAALRRPDATASVPQALNNLVDAAVTNYERWAHGRPVMLVHAATAPRAIALTVPSLPQQLWLDSFDAAWSIAAAITTIYRPDHRAPEPAQPERPIHHPDEATTEIRNCDDEHAIKFTEVACESRQRGNPMAMPAVARALQLLSG
jgi:hypothetical protein